MRVAIRALVAAVVLFACAAPVVRADDAAKKPQLSAAQQDLVGKLQAKGALVLPLAANSDALVVSLANGGKAAGDAELEMIKQLPKVEQLDLRSTGVTDKGLASVGAMTSLTTLHLENTAVTDAGIAHLKALANLQYLNLFNTAVTDKGVAELSGLKNLKKLYLWETKVTDAGAANLKKAIPGLYVNRGEELAITTQPATPIPTAPPKTAAVAGATPKAGPKPAAPTAVEPKSNVDVAIDATVAAAKAAIDAKAAEAKAAIDAKANEAKAAIDKIASLRTTTAAPAPAQAALASDKIVNTKCPLSGDAVDPTHFVVFEGRKIGFCCEKCPAKFNADPKKYIDKVVADAK